MGGILQVQETPHRINLARQNAKAANVPWLIEVIYAKTPPLAEVHQTTKCGLLAINCKRRYFWLIFCTGPLSVIHESDLAPTILNI
jgi:hypothetical protein